MILDDVTSFWWENITGPQMLVQNIAACLSDGKNVILQMNSNFPWREQMRDFVAHRLERIHLRTLSWHGVKTQDQIVPALLDQLHRTELSSCPMDYKAQLTYLRNEGILANSVVWIVPESSDNQSALLKFLSDYRGKGLEQHGAFVLELTDERGMSLSSRNAVLRCSDYIRSSDLLLYASILADSTPGNPDLKGYMAHAAVNLAGDNAELIHELLQRIDFEREDLGEALARMWDEGSISHPSQPPDRQELQMSVWKAQLQSAFALIEMERLHIVDEYSDIIEEALGVEYWDPKHNETGFVHQRNDELDSAADVELGTLAWMLKVRRDADRSQYLLYIPDEEIRSRISFLSTCRNNLAHHRVCTPEQMCGLLSPAKSK